MNNRSVYFKTWYEKHKEVYLPKRQAKRNERYREDPDYRKKVISYARQYYAKNAEHKREYQRQCYVKNNLL
jgi:hypothetical protein